MSEAQNPVFGITKDTKANNAAPIRVAKKVENNPQFPGGWEFPIARLVNVTSNPELEKKDGSKTAVLDFVFVDRDKRRFIHREWELDLSDNKLNDKIGYMQTRIKHIWVTVFGSFPSDGIGTDAEGFKDFFTKVAEAFNSKTFEKVNNDGQKKQYPLYAKQEVYIKLTYYKKRLGFPLSPDFLERVEESKPCRVLIINPVHDKLEPQKGAAGIPGASSGGGGGMSPEGGDDLPSFEDGFN